MTEYPINEGQGSIATSEGIIFSVPTGKSAKITCITITNTNDVTAAWVEVYKSDLKGKKISMNGKRIIYPEGGFSKDVSIYYLQPGEKLVASAENNNFTYSISGILTDFKK